MAENEGLMAVEIESLTPLIEVFEDHPRAGGAGASGARR
jgi:hypothetical protein